MRCTTFKVLFSLGMLAVYSHSTAKDYVGIDLCGKATLAEMTELLRLKGASIKSDYRSLDYETIDATGFVVEGVSLDISVTLFREEVMEVSLSDVSDFSELIPAKYGKHVKFHHSIDEDGSLRKWSYLDRSFKAADISVSRYIGFSSAYDKVSLTYSCKPLEAEHTRSVRLSAASRAKKSSL